MSDSEDPIDLADEGGDDLFGDDDADPKSDRERYLSDNELASNGGAAEDNAMDYDDDEAAQTQQTKDEIVMDIALSRHRKPKVKNGTLQSLRVPSFLSFHAREYDPDTFEPTPWDMENARSDKPKGVVRFRRDSTTGEMASNTLIHRWSDGSLTIAVGGTHYEIQTKKMASSSDKYQERQDSHYYAAAPHFLKDSLLTVGHVTEQYTVLVNRDMQDEATLKLAEDMAAAARGKRPNENEMIITATRDPELQKKEAELAEKERMKAQRRRENAAARVDSRGTGYRSGGLSVNDLEGGRRGTGGSRKRGAGGASRAKRRRPEYDSDDDLPSGTRRQDEYDREDDFIAPSDDDMASEAEDDEEEEDLLDDEEEEAPRKKRQKTAESEEDADADADADADLDDLDAPAPTEQSRSRRRNIIDDDDE
ncbi:Leo1-like protein-domain-containing protein [Xylaria bambusicola]|uniref:Leo1-like protein-domain-containing protein n=1 Tax=Xylaria bambusicola TaxID=326684 RepID=UPI002007A38A|nr:Leo1-like protein-domain-containing protein [Xylaria bambusicola]KAI0523728.1 Leo1-like protein-domain-containing protein [Xylaria bambusicola]